MLFRLTMPTIQLKKLAITDKIEKEILDHDHGKHITTQEFNKLTEENFTSKFKTRKFGR